MRKRFQNRMAESRMLFASAILYALVVWAIRFVHTINGGIPMNSMLMDTMPCFIVFTINIFLMVELNNRNALLRTYSRTVSGSYVVLMLLTPWITADLYMLIVQTCLISYLLFLFSTYQERHASGRVYFAYLFIGLASLLWLPIIIFVPFLLIFHLLYIYSLNTKSFITALLGVLTPYWCLSPYYIWNLPLGEENQFSLSFNYMKLFDIVEINTSWFTSLINDNTMLLNIVAMGIVLLMATIGIIHYIRKSYEDKIHVRMLFSFFCLFATLLALFELSLLFLPIESERHFGMLLMMLIVIVSPLIAHFITFTHTRFTNAITIILILTALTMSLTSSLLL